MKYVNIVVFAGSLFVGACSSEHGGHDPSADAGTVGEGGGGTFASIPNPALVVANGGTGTVHIIDPTTLAVVSSVSAGLGLHPHHVAVAPDKTAVLITATSADLSEGHGGEHGGGHGAAATTFVYRIDVASREMKKAITVDAIAHNAAFTPDGNLIVLGMMEHGTVAAYNAATFAEVFSTPGFQMPLEVTPTSVGVLLVAESGASRIAAFDIASRSVTSTFDVGSTPVAAWASGGPNYFVSVEGGRAVRHLVEGDTNVTLDSHSLDPGGIPGQAVLTPNGTELWVAVEDRALVAIFDASTHAKLSEFAAGTKPHGVAFEPSGARAFVTDESGGRVLVVDVAGRQVTSEIAVGGKPNGIAWIAR
ncbi:MAG: hypothetical protein ABI895_26535 [Deltaproteobacteria bacterium]